MDRRHDCAGMHKLQGMKPHDTPRLTPSDSSSKNSARVPSAILCLCHGSLATLVPAKSRGLGAIQQDGHRTGPTTFGGTAVIGEATDGDGDENSSREQSSTFKNELAD